MKLHGKEWFGIMLNSFAGSIVGVFEEDAPLLAEGGSVDGKTMGLTLKPEVKQPDNVQVRIKPSYSEGLSIANPFPYDASNPIPMDEPMGDGVVYRIQLGAYSQPINYNIFKGLAPLSGETVKGGVLKKYFAGLFHTLNEAQVGLVLAKSVGFKDAYVVSWTSIKLILATQLLITSKLSLIWYLSPSWNE